MDPRQHHHQQQHHRHQQQQQNSIPPPQMQLPQPQPHPQLPPQMFTTAASLLDLTDKKLVVALRDGRKVLGILRSWDQFGNLVLQDAVERTFASSLPSSSSSAGAPPPPSSSSLSTSAANATEKSQEKEEEERHIYADSPRGIYLVRGENVTLMGEVDLDRDEHEHVPPPWQLAPEADVFELRRRQTLADKRRDAAKARAMRALGFEGEGGGEAIEI